jgi:hypothetical protein
LEIIVYDYGVEQSREVVAVVDYQKLSQDIERRPEDYIFLLTPVEYDKYCELNQQIRAGLQGKPMNIDEEDYTKQYPIVFVIASLAPKPGFVQKWKIADMTQHTLVGDNHIVFYISRADRHMDRAKQVLKRIADFKAEVSGHTES